MQSRRIAMISYHTCPLSDEEGKETGGMNIYVLELSKELAKKGFVVDIYTRLQDNNNPRIVNVSTNLRVIHLPAGETGAIPKTKLIRHIPEFLESFYQFVKKENLTFSVISCHYYMSGLIGLDIKKKLKLPMLMTFHTLGLLKNLVARGEEEKEDIKRIKIELMLVSEADKVIATSDVDAEYIKTLYNSPSGKVSVLIPGINLELFRPIQKHLARKKVQADDNFKYILFVGRIEPLKGIDIILYALKILLEKNPRLKLCLWIVGGDVTEGVEKWSKELQKLEQIRKLLHISASVKFVGRKPQKELPYYYNASEIVVMPSHYESFGISALEAMACGTPVITTDVTGVSDIFDKKHAKLITSANNPLLLADKIKNLLSNEREYRKVSYEVYKKVQDLSWSQVTKKFISLCKECYKKE